MFQLFFAFLQLFFGSAFAQDRLTISVTNDTTSEILVGFTPGVARDGSQVETCAVRADIPGVSYKAFAVSSTVTVTENLNYAIWHVGIYDTDNKLQPGTCRSYAAPRNSTVTYEVKAVLETPLLLTVETKYVPAEAMLAVFPEGNNCPNVVPAIDQSTVGISYFLDFAAQTWPLPIKVGSYSSIGLYVKNGDQYDLVALSCVIDIHKTEAYTAQMFLPEPVVTVPVKQKEASSFEPATTTYLGTMLYPGWDRLVPVVSFMAEPRSIQLGQTSYWFNAVVFGGLVADEATDYTLLMDVGAGGMVGGNIHQRNRVTVSGETGLMLGYGPSIWGCQSNTVTAGNSLELNCQPTTEDDAITLRTQAPWYSFVMQVAADVSLNKVRIGLGLWGQVRLIDGNPFMPDLGKQTTSVVGTDGATYQAHYVIAGNGLTSVVTVGPAVKIVWE